MFPNKAIPIGAFLLVAVSGPAVAQAPQSAPPAVGVIDVARRPIIETSEFLGRVEAVNRVSVVARVTAFLNKRLFEEGNEVATGDRLYALERASFEADLNAKKAQVAQLQATLQNATTTTERQRILLQGPAGTQANFDSAIANQKSLEAQVQAAQAQVSLSQINVDYTDIRSPINGRIGRTSVTEGNVVTPTSGELTTIVSQDPMYVTFPISVRQVLELRTQYAGKGGYNAVVIRLKLPDGRTYRQTGHLNFADNTISRNTDTLTVRGTIPNPKTTLGDRELTDGEFVTVLLEGVAPVSLPAIPRAAVLSDQKGDYVFVVGAENKIEQRRIKLGQSTAEVASVVDGLKVGDKVVAEGVQRARPGQPVAPGTVSAQMQSTMDRSDPNAPGGVAPKNSGAAK